MGQISHTCQRKTHRPAISAKNGISVATTIANCIVSINGETEKERNTIMITNVGALCAEISKHLAEAVETNREFIDDKGRVGGIMKPLKGFLRKVDKTIKGKDK